MPKIKYDLQIERRIYNKAKCELELQGTIQKLIEVIPETFTYMFKVMKLIVVVHGGDLGYVITKLFSHTFRDLNVGVIG
jgi:hypothetical protein